MGVLDDTRHENIADFLGVEAGGAPGNWEYCLDGGMWGHSGKSSRIDTNSNMDLNVDLIATVSIVFVGRCGDILVALPGIQTHISSTTTTIFSTDQKQFDLDLDNCPFRRNTFQVQLQIHSSHFWREYVYMNTDTNPAVTDPIVLMWRHSGHQSGGINGFRLGFVNCLLPR